MFPFSIDGYKVSKEEFEQYKQDLANQDVLEESESFYSIPGYVDFFSGLIKVFFWKTFLLEVVKGIFNVVFF